MRQMLLTGVNEKLMKSNIKGNAPNYLIGKESELQMGTRRVLPNAPFVAPDSSTDCD